MTRRFLRLLLLGGGLGAGLLDAAAADAALAKAAVLENNVAYLRVDRADGTLPGEIQAAQTALAATNQIAGVVLDLRFAEGGGMTATNFFPEKKWPLVILVNTETRGAAAAWAADLRAARAGLILGNSAILKTDIAINTRPADEKMFWENPYAAAGGETNSIVTTNEDLSTFIDHTSEADLVREKIKDGEEDEDAAPARPPEPQKPWIHDPVLARAVDLIKALAVLRPAQA